MGGDMNAREAGVTLERRDATELNDKYYDDDEQ